jgi:hypothetical protein
MGEKVLRYLEVGVFQDVIRRQGVHQDGFFFFFGLS